MRVAFVDPVLVMAPRSILSSCLLCVIVAGCDPVGDDVIGAEGGVVTSRDGRLILDIPAGALDDAVEITVEEVEALPPGALGPAYRVLPVGTVFNEPVEVLYNYSAAGMDIDPDEVRLVVERADDWSPLPDRVLHDEERVVSASALYLSTFGVALQER